MNKIYYDPEESAGSSSTQEEMKSASGLDTICQNKLKTKDTEYTKKIKEDFGFFGTVSLFYALFYTFCMYKNGSGITYPFFAAGNLLFFYSCLTRLGISLKKGSVFYMVGIMLLAVSTFSTDDSRIILLNKIGFFLLLMSLLLRQLYDTSSWKPGRYLCNIIIVTFASIGEIARPFQDMGGFYKTKMKGRLPKAIYVVVGAVFAIPLFLIVFSLLISADAVFRNMTRQITETVELGNVFMMFFMTIFMFLSVYCILSYLCKKALPEENKDKRKGEPLIAITITLILSVLYLLFSAVQIIYLFMGRMQLPQGYTYAEYAREGFFQLLFVSILNLVIVLVCMSFFKSSKVLKGILTVMSLCTFIMIASSAMRMIIYIQYYYLTFLRIFVLWSLIVLFLLFVGVVAGIYWEKFPLFRYGMAIISVCFLMLSFSHPDYWIAKINLSNIEPNGKYTFLQGERIARNDLSTTDYVAAEEVMWDKYEDYYYLATLSMDAAPVILPFLQENGYDLSQTGITKEGQTNDAKEEDFGKIDDNIVRMGNRYLKSLVDKTQDSGIRHFNISRHMAWKKLADLK